MCITINGMEHKLRENKSFEVHGMYLCNYGFTSAKFVRVTRGVTISNLKVREFLTKIASKEDFHPGFCLKRI